MKKKFLSVLLTVLFIIAFARAVNALPITNGDFSGGTAGWSGWAAPIGPFGGLALNPPPPGSGIPVPPIEGVSALFSSGSVYSGNPVTYSLSQTIDLTTSSSSVALSWTDQFVFLQTGLGGSSWSVALYDKDNPNILKYTAFYAPPPNSTGITQHYVDLTPYKDSQYELRFTASFFAGNSFIQLDNVSIVVPEPSTVFLAGLSLGAMAFYFRRRYNT